MVEYYDVIDPFFLQEQKTEPAQQTMSSSEPATLSPTSSDDKPITVSNSQNDVIQVLSLNKVCTTASQELIGSGIHIFSGDCAMFDPLYQAFH